MIILYIVSLSMIVFNININLLQVIDHYENPRNVGALDKNDKNVGTGLVGAPACGDVMKLQVRTLASGTQTLSNGDLL